MSSRSSSSSRNTIVNLLQKEDGRLPVTPTKKTEGAIDPFVPNSDKTPTSSLQDRRDRRNVGTGTFRPLSIFTNSTLIPFNHNFDRAFDVLKSDSPDRLTLARNLLSSEPADTVGRDSSKDLANGNVTTPNGSDPTKKLMNLSNTRVKVVSVRRTERRTPRHPESPSKMAQQALQDDSDMDLIEALKSTSPEKDSNVRINGEFQALRILPVPDIASHPAFASHPFEVKTKASLLFTSTPADDIRAYYAKKSNIVVKAPDTGKKTIERKKSRFNLGFSTSSSTQSRSMFGSPEDQQFSTSQHSASTRSARSSLKDISPVGVEFSSFRDSTSTEQSNGVRKLSDIFRRKDSLEKSDPSSPAWSPRLSLETPNTDRQDLEKYLRRTTCTPSFDYDPYCSYPRHPNTGRGWKSRNLKCTNCTNVDCAVCHRVCCAYRAAVLALDNHPDGSPGRPTALQQILEITKLFPYGKETPTFLQCTAGPTGHDMGCGKLVCPDCCSVCPDDACADTVCRRCKPAMWEDCEWHANGILRAEEQNWS